jgi:DNA end-binding protein Ku
MRALWKGAITFGLVTIPVSLFPATRREELKFRLLRASDHSPVNYKRVAEVDGKEVPWDQIVKGYEYEKGKFVLLKEEDFARVDVEATQTVDIMNFVSLDDVDPLLFYKPYYLEAGKGGDKAYVLLRDALNETGKIAIAKVVIRTRQHLAAVKPQEKGLMLELMHFPKELVPVEEFNKPAEKAVGKAEMQMAKQLIGSMTSDWDPDQYNDEYRDALEKLIEEKLENPDKAPAPAKKPKATNVIDLVSVLQESPQQFKGKSTAKKKKKPAARKQASRPNERRQLSEKKVCGCHSADDSRPFRVRASHAGRIRLSNRAAFPRS